MNKYFYAIGLTFFFIAGAGSVLLVDLVRRHLNPSLFGARAIEYEESTGQAIIPLITEEQQGDNYWNENVPAEDSASAENPPGSIPAYSFATAVERASPAVVNVYSSRAVIEEDDFSPFFENPFFEDFFDRPSVPREQLLRSLGSGVVINSDGYIVTNYHVVKEADEILIAFSDQQEITAQIVGADPETDLALLKTDLNDLPAIAIGNMEQINIGDLVLAIGNPYGVGQTVTQGILSAIGRSDIGVATFENFLQTDAAINPGNSGGALINVRGELIGINTAIYSRSGQSGGIGFAIPVDLVMRIVDQLLDGGSVERGWMGVSLRSQVQGDESTIFINGVFRDSPAAGLDIRTGDELVSLDGEYFENITEVLNYVAGKNPGEEIRLSIRRNDNIIDFLMVLGNRPVGNPSNN